MCVINTCMSSISFIVLIFFSEKLTFKSTALASVYLHIKENTKSTKRKHTHIGSLKSDIKLHMLTYPKL